MNNITVGKIRNGYINIDLDSLRMFNGANYTLNDKKYLEGEKKSACVYTVIGIVYSDVENKYLEGYIISNNNGELSLVKEDKLISLLKKNYCMNYSLIKKEGTEYYLRKNPNVVIKIFLDSDVKEILGYSFVDFKLNSGMNLDELHFCLSNNDFKLAYRNDFPVEYYNSILQGTHLVYFNEEGTQIILNYVNKNEKHLQYYRQTCMIMRDVDHKKYINYLRNNPYNSCSSSPLVDVCDPNLDPNKSEILFTSHTLERFLNISEMAKTYSKPIIPYSLGSNMYGIHSVLHITPYQEKMIKEYLEQKKYTDWDYSSFMRLYLGYLNMLKYSVELKKFYRNYINSLPTYFENYERIMVTKKVTKQDIKDMHKFIEKIS